jgi:hypothetical protein
VLNRHGQSKEELPAASRGLTKKPSLAFKIGLILGSVHLFYILFNVIDIIHRQEGQWHMFWILCGYIDFPVTLLLSRVILPIVAPLFTCHDPYLVAGRGPLFIIFLLFHSLVGSGWYFALPILISKALAKIASTKKTAVAAAALMIIPVPAHWLQLVRFFGYDTAPTAIGLNSILPGVWTIIFVWLLIVNVRRKVLLWLICLAPFVFYYLEQDLYYCIVLARH